MRDRTDEEGGRKEDGLGGSEHLKLLKFVGKAKGGGEQNSTIGTAKRENYEANGK
jgi:hypothetical protein